MNPHRLLCYLAISAFSLPAYTQVDTSIDNVTLINAYDAFGRDQSDLTQDFGFSCIVYYKGKMILFDAGTDTKIFEANIKALDIDLKKIDIAVLSHGHSDHTGGLDHLINVNPQVKIYLPNDFFSLGAPIKFPFKEPDASAAEALTEDERYFRGKAFVEGMQTVPTGRYARGNIEYVVAPKEVLPGITLIPTTSELMGTFIKYPPFDKTPQFIGMPELSVSFSTPKGLVLIAGCSHTTIESIVKETQQLIGTNIFLVAGGFHLIPYDRTYIEGLAKRMKEVYRIESVAPAHCTGHSGFSIFKEQYGKDYRFFGLGQSINLTF